MPVTVQNVYRDTWVWYLPSNGAQHAKALADSGCERALVKAGGDGGRVWEQWGPRLSIYDDAGIAPIPWHYVHPDDDAEFGAIVATLRKRWAPELLLNPEMEWWGKGREYTLRWMQTLRSAIRAAHGKVPEIGWSSVPTWTRFPYEAWSEACDGTEQPQVYWRLFRADQVRASNERARVGAKIVPILPACQSEDSGNDGMVWTDAALADLVRAINQGLRDQVGYSGWQSGATGVGGRARSDYGHAAMRAAYASLADWVVEPNPDQAVLYLPFNTSPNPDVWRCQTPDGAIDAWVVQPEFIDFYQGLGDRALELLGLPISGMSPDREGRLVQWFERCRMELHGPHVALGLVGAEALRAADAAAWGEFIPKILNTVA